MARRKKTSSRQGRRRTANRLLRDPDPERRGAPAVDGHRVVRVWRRVLERKMKRRLPGGVSVAIHDNTHTMMTFRRRGGRWHLRLHHMFLAAPDEVLAALADYVRTGESAASLALDRFIERNRAFIRRITPAQLRRRLRIQPSGRHHDLAAIFRGLNRRYFRDRVTATITYGPAPRTGGPRKSIKMGSYSVETKVIRIHPALDQQRVPRFFVEWIVFHEMLHHVHRARRLEDGRRCVHTPELLEQERTFHDYARATRWEDENLDLLLGGPG